MLGLNVTAPLHGKANIATMDNYAMTSNVTASFGDKAHSATRLLLNPPTQVPEFAKLQGARSAS